MARQIARQTEPRPYILLADRALPEHEQSVFTLRSLTQAERMAVYDNESWVRVEDDGTHTILTRSFAQARQLVLSHLVRVERFPLEAPQAWPEKGLPADREKYLEMLDSMDVFELGNEIRRRALRPEPVAAMSSEAAADGAA